MTSPVGEITLATDGEAITHLHIEGDRYFTQIPSDWKWDSENSVLKKAQKELREYFEGKRKKFDFSIKFTGTPFQESVWKALQEIPSGKTVSYTDLAEKIGKPKAVRAVGSAVGRNPICIIVPCHRVLASNGAFGGYVAGIQCKEYLLQVESR